MKHNTVFTYIKVPPQVSQYEPSFVHRIVMYDRTDTGQNIHVRVPKGFNIELTVLFTSWEESSLVDTLKVQHTSRVGGAHDRARIDIHSIIPKAFDESYKEIMHCTIDQLLHCITIASMKVVGIGQGSLMNTANICMHT